jgi:ABC-type glutathione transport system ATPase component
MSDDVLAADGVSVRFGHTTALDDVGLRIGAGRTVGLVGESGSGKTTLARAILGLVPISSGRILLRGADVGALGRRERRAFLRAVQLVPQDPYSSLDPRRTIGQTLAEALDPVRCRVRRHREAITAALEDVALPADAIDRYPHEFSGGQRQRIAIARALTMLFISHNLAVVQQVCDDVVVLYRGKVIESGLTADVFADPTQEYTQRLLDSVPQLSVSQ